VTDNQTGIVEAGQGTSTDREHSPRVYTHREIFVRRVLFYGGIVGWVLLLMIPFSVFMLSIMGEFTFNLPGDYPESELRIWMVMEQDERGIAYSYGRVSDRSESSLAVQQTVRYVLWEGESEYIQFCQLYSRTGSEDGWTFEVSEEGRCES